MIQITNGVDYCEFEEVTRERYPISLGGYGYCIRVNGMLIKMVSKTEYKDYSVLEMVFGKFVRCNYPSFWKAPFKYLLGGKKCYNWDKIRHC